MNRNKILLPLAVLVTGALVAAALVLTRERVAVEPARVQAPLVRVTEARRGPHLLRVRTHGTVTPRTESELVPEVSGPIVEVAPSFVSGGFFEQGDVLLRIDARDYEVALEDARANLARRESEAARSKKELERQQRLARQNVASASRLDDAENAARIAEAALRQARAALEKGERDLARTEMRAPFTGRVRQEAVDVGQFVNRGSRVATIYAVDRAEVRLPVADEELAFLDLPLLYRGEALGQGPRVVLSADFAGRRHAWEGRVVRTEGEIDPRTRMVHVVAQIEDPYAANGENRPPLSVGLFVEAEIHGRTIEDAVVLPRTALRQGDRVWVVDEEDQLRIRTVDVLRVDRDEIVIQGGIADGERVCTSQISSVVDGMSVRPVVEERAAELAG